MLTLGVYFMRKLPLLYTTITMKNSPTYQFIIIIIIFISRLPERPQKPIELATIKQHNSRKKTVRNKDTKSKNYKK